MDGSRFGNAHCPFKFARELSESLPNLGGLLTQGGHHFFGH